MFTLIYFILINFFTLLFYCYTQYNITVKTDGDCNKEYSLFLTTFILTIIKIGLAFLLFILLKRMKTRTGAKYFKTTLLGILFIINIINTTIIFVHYDKYSSSRGSCILSKTDEIIYIFSNFLTISADMLLAYYIYNQTQSITVRFNQMI